MKRIIATILAILYMLSATSATVHMHYCMGHLVSTGLVHKDHDRCGKCGMKKTAQRKGCCKDERKTLKSADHQLAKASFDCGKSPAHIVPAQIIPYYTAYTTALPAHNISRINAPPSHWRTVPIYLQVCNFRI